MKMSQLAEFALLNYVHGDPIFKESEFIDLASISSRGCTAIRMK